MISRDVQHGDSNIFVERNVENIQRSTPIFLWNSFMAELDKIVVHV